MGLFNLFSKIPLHTQKHYCTRCKKEISDDETKWIGNDRFCIACANSSLKPNDSDLQSRQCDSEPLPDSLICTAHSRKYENGEKQYIQFWFSPPNWKIMCRYRRNGQTCAPTLIQVISQDEPILLSPWFDEHGCTAANIKLIHERLMICRQTYAQYLTMSDEEIRARLEYNAYQDMSGNPNRNPYSDIEAAIGSCVLHMRKR